MDFAVGLPTFLHDLVNKYGCQERTTFHKLRVMRINSKRHQRTPGISSCLATPRAGNQEEYSFESLRDESLNAGKPLHPGAVATRPQMRQRSIGIGLVNVQKLVGTE